MLCQNCGEREANFHYTQMINGVKKEIVLCDKCSRELGIGNFDFNIPINFSSFLGEFLEQEDKIPTFIPTTQFKCNTCGMTFEDFVNGGKFGCPTCFDVFTNKIEPILKNLHGSCMHTGRRGIASQNQEEKQNKENVQQPLKKENDKLEELKRKLKQAIQEERYEDAAKIRDEIKKIEG